MTHNHDDASRITPEPPAAHSPGPWKIYWGNDNETGQYPAEIGCATGHPVAYIPVPDPAASGTTVSNAQLIAAAPELLAACQAVMPILRAYIHPDQFDGHAARAMILVRDALAKAKGD